MSCWKYLVACAVLGLAVLPSARAEGDKPDRAAPAAAANDEQIAKLVEQLDADLFTQRKDATEKLIAIGKPAIAAVAKAATGDSLEVTSRSIDILKKLYQSSDEPTKTAAKEALEKLATCQQPSAARRAKEVLKKDDPNLQGANGGIMQGGIAIGQIQIAVGGAGAKRVSVKNNNGVKEIEVEENGKKTKIVEEANKGIKVEITTKDDKGKEKTEKIEAKDAEDLKKKNKEAHDLYQQYSQNAAGGAIQVQFGGGGIVPVPAVPLPAQRGNAPNFRGNAQRNNVEIARVMLQSLGQQIARLTGEDALKSASKEQLEKLKNQIDELKKQIDDAEKRIQEAAKTAESKPDEAKPADPTGARPASSRLIDPKPAEDQPAPAPALVPQAKTTLPVPRNAR